MFSALVIPWQIEQRETKKEAQWYECGIWGFAFLLRVSLDNSFNLIIFDFTINVCKTDYFLRHFPENIAGKTMKVKTERGKEHLH